MSPKSASKRRFEFVEGNSSKFWHIEVLEKEVRIQFGRIGTVGQCVTKTFRDAAAAAKHAGNVAIKKLAKGYIEVAA